MMRLYRLAALAGLALVGASAPVQAHGAFGLFYDRCTGCCAGCDKPWNAFSGGAAPAGYGGCGPMPCLPYQGPGDPKGGRYHGLHRWFGRYGCGEEGIGCGMGCSFGCQVKESCFAKFHSLFQSPCCNRDGQAGGCDDGHCGAKGRLFHGLGGGHGCGRMRLFGSSLFNTKGAVVPCDSGCCGSANTTPIAPVVAQPATTKPTVQQTGYPVYYPTPYAPMQFVPVQYPGQAPLWGHWSPAPTYYPFTRGQ